MRLSWNAGPAIARNIGLKVAKQLRAAVVCFLDDDCVPQPGWLAAMEAAQMAHPGIVCGRTVALDPNTLIGAPSSLSMVPVLLPGVLPSSPMSPVCSAS